MHYIFKKKSKITYAIMCFMYIDTYMNQMVFDSYNNIIVKDYICDFFKVHKREKFFGSDFEFFTIL